MRNHDEKARDMARSILPSTARKGARDARTHIRGRERARERDLLHQLRFCVDPDDFEGVLGEELHHEMASMVWDRRAADKVAPLLRWTERTIARDARLATASPAEREVHFRNLLPPGLIGDHAVSHLRWVLDDRPWPSRSRRRVGGSDALVPLVEDVVAAGRHGDLNRRIRAEVPRKVVRDVLLPAERIVDDENPAPGRLVPRRRVREVLDRPVRFLAGAHDIEAFARDASWEVREVVRAVHAAVIVRG